MKKYSLYRVDFIITKQGHIHDRSDEFIALGPREAIADARKFVFRETGEHAFRCKAKLVNL